MPYFFNSNYRHGGKSLTVRSVQTIATPAAALLAITVASRAAADEVTRWNQIASDASTVVDTNPLKESCIFSILHVTIHNAVNAVESRYEPYRSGISPTPGGQSKQQSRAPHTTHWWFCSLHQNQRVADWVFENALRPVGPRPATTATAVPEKAPR